MVKSGEEGEEGPRTTDKKKGKKKSFSFFLS